MLQESGLIHWRCEAAGHRQCLDGRPADTLTVHEDRWAYCPMDAGAAGHEWTATGGVRIETLRRSSPKIDLDLDIRPHVDGDASVPSSRGRPAARAGGGTTRKRATSKD